MKKFFQLVVCVIGCELVGLSGTPFTIAAIPTWYTTLAKPFFAPPNWLFGPVWTLLYALMGVSVFLIWKNGTKQARNRRALLIFGIQLALNFLWTPVFFGLKSPLFGLVVIVMLWVAIVQTMKAFAPVSRLASILLLPYLLWVSFATALNAGIAVLN